MSTFDRVKSAASPQDALLAIAHSLDSLHAKLDQPSSPWSALETEWTEDTPPLIDEDKPKKWSPPDAVLDAIVALQEELKSATGDDRRALEAKLTLLKDELKPPPEFASAERLRTAQEVAPGGDVQVELPPPSPALMKARAELAEQVHMADDFGEEIVESFIKGGPLLLYYSDRDYVMGLPPVIRKLLVEDVAQYSPAEAEEMGRDVLKDESPGDPQSTIERMHLDV